MSQEQFLKRLAVDGFPEPILITREPGGFLDHHAHPFEVKALVVGGQIDLLVEGIRTKYLAGDVFHLPRNQVHAEWYGNQGVQYLASRKYFP